MSDPVDENAERPVVIVTGSSSGIGEAIARRFAAAGDAVLVNSAHSVAAGQAVADSLPEARYVQGDIANGDDVERLVNVALETWGRIDTLVNNAGTTVMIPHHDLAAASVDVWRQIFEVNVFGTWAMTVASVPALRESKGSVINVGSIAGSRPTGSSIPYAASKAALHHLTVLLAKTLGPDVRVNAVAPGLIDTAWTTSWTTQRAVVGEIAALRRVGTAGEVAEAVAALAGATYTTGQVVLVDGGLSLA